MSTADDARATRERKAEHEKQQADLPGSISSDDQSSKERREGAQAGSTGEPLGNLSDKQRDRVVKQREETTKVYAQVAEDTEKLREQSAKEAAEQQAKAAKEQLEEQGAWKWPDEPLPGELPPYSTARDALEQDKRASRSDRRRSDDDTDTVKVSKA